MGDTAAVDKVGGEGIAVQLGVIFAEAGLGYAYVEQYNIARKLTARDVKLTRFYGSERKGHIRTKRVFIGVPVGCVTAGSDVGTEAQGGAPVAVGEEPSDRGSKLAVEACAVDAVNDDAAGAKLTQHRFRLVGVA